MSHLGIAGQPITYPNITTTQQARWAALIQQKVTTGLTDADKIELKEIQREARMIK